jgi:hypothetical protein
MLSLALLITLCVGCARRQVERRSGEEAKLWDVYCGADPYEAARSQQTLRADILRLTPYTLEHGRGVTNILLVTDLRLFALSYYLGQSNIAERWFKEYTNVLGQLRKEDLKTISPNNALLSLELLERQFDIKWKLKTNELTYLPPSKGNVENYARSLGVAAPPVRLPLESK